MVRRRPGERRTRVRPPVGERGGGGRRPLRGRRARVVDLGRDVAPGDAARRVPRRARSARGRPRGALHADVPGGRGRVACVRAHRRRPGADLLRLRGAGRRLEARGLSGEGRHLRRLVAAPRQAHRDDGDARRGRAVRGRVRHRVEPGDAFVAGRSDAAAGGSRRSRSTPRRRYLLAYTSGTTGRPKGALHVQGRFLVSIARELAYQTGRQRGDRIHFVTDMGWIMGPWTVVGGGAVGATIVFAEGAPDWPDDRLWRLVESEQVTMLGVSPTLMRALSPKGEPARTSRHCARSARRESRGTSIRTSRPSTASAADGFRS